MAILKQAGIDEPPREGNELLSDVTHSASTSEEARNEY